MELFESPILLEPQHSREEMPLVIGGSSRISALPLRNVQHAHRVVTTHIVEHVGLVGLSGKTRV